MTTEDKGKPVSERVLRLAGYALRLSKTGKKKEIRG